MVFNYQKLLGKMRERGISQAFLAKRIGISEAHLNRKLKGVFAFTQDEIFNICDELEISPCEINAYFFTVEVEKPKLPEE
jgi:transcriptional regulator with XRE-family HTH domain